MVNKSKEAYVETKERFSGVGISFDKVSLSYGERVILDEVSFYIAPGDFVGLVGPNGVGKTTILRLIVHEEKPDLGEINVFPRKGACVGYMPQTIPEQDLHEEKSVLQFMISAKGLDKIISEIDDVSHTMVEGEQLGSAELTRLADLQETFIRAGGREAEATVKMILSGLGIPAKSLDIPVSTLSGGMKTRTSMARVLYSDPDLILLDEPTNHLDDQGITWLGNYLRSFTGTGIVVSHQRDFLDKFCKKILYLNPSTHKVETYHGNYSFFLSLKDEGEKRLAQLAARQEEERKRLQAFIDRWRAGTRAKQAQSRLKALERMRRIEAPRREKQIRVIFPVNEKSGDPVVTIEGISKTFGDKKLFPALSFSIRRGERILVDGPNGAGKTTLLKMIAGLEKPTEGLIKLGYKANVGYYDQEGKTLDQNLTPHEQLENHFPGGYQRIKQVLSFFLLSEHSSTVIGRLSQGEKSRLVLAQLMMSGANFLILDEPTNHLDTRSKTSLVDALSSYQGTVILVSHDEELLSGLKIDRVLTLPSGQWSYWLKI
jgi:ATPase subunit of ABC transporter with duplicated ATPase domains